ncbi:MAG: hypothetical protein ACK58T_42480, partial [Phycisphaerae bacterium]
MRENHPLEAVGICRLNPADLKHWGSSESHQAVSGESDARDVSLPDFGFVIPAQAGIQCPTFDQDPAQMT